MVSETLATVERRGLLPRFTLKDGDTFLLADAVGDVQDGQDGFFASDTRLISQLQLEIAGRQPSLLGGAIARDNVVFTSQLTNRPLPALGERTIPQGVIHLERSRFLCGGHLHERWRFTNFSGEHAIVPLTLRFRADFADIFEVQGLRRKQRGELLPPEVDASTVSLSYRGLDAQLRTVQLSFSPAPASLSSAEATYSLSLARDSVTEVFLEISEVPVGDACAERFDAQLKLARHSMRQRFEQGGSVSGSGRLFEAWLDQSRSDLALLTTALPTGPYPYAGIPWFATQFGRDGIITALQTLWLDPQLAAGVLRFLASTQATETSAFRDSEPGKIMHEMRRGEMAHLDEVPFRRYYGGVDSTPLFVMLAGAYEERTADRALINELWPNLLAATGWIERRLDHGATGFLDYARGADSGLANQGWKDSHDAIFHADGRLPTGPIAVVEVQGYAYAALNAMARLAGQRAAHAESARWKARASRLRQAIEQRFWIDELNFYALAIDGENRPCAVRASNAGHLLYCGVVEPERAARVARQLLGPEFYNGWGIRTVPVGAARYNPMAYHNGTVWPHDTALCAAGIARYLGPEAIVPILSGLFEAAAHFAMRLPELFCGFERVKGQPPTPYPVACQPQAWASGSVFMLLGASLGIRIRASDRDVHFHRPRLPVGIESLVLKSLPIGPGTIDVQLHRLGEDVLVIPERHAESGVEVLTHG
jgi:glycogen debranching enzyme